MNARFRLVCCSHGDEVDTFESCSMQFLVPDLEHLFHVTDAAGAIDQEHRLVMHADVARVAEDLDQIGDVLAPIFRTAVDLRHQYMPLPPIPSARPGLVSPSKTKWKIRLATLEKLFDRALQQLPTIEPIVVVTKTM